MSPARLSSLPVLGLVFALACATPAHAGEIAGDSTCDAGVVYEDRDADGRRDDGEPGIAGVRLSDGVRLVTTDSAGRYTLAPRDGASQFLIKPVGYALPMRDDGLPDFWQNQQLSPGPQLRYGGMAQTGATCRDYALVRQHDVGGNGTLDVLVFADPQVKSLVDVDYYRRDIVEPLLAGGEGGAPAQLGLSLGDIVNDDLALYPALNAVTARLRVPWLHAAGNHDLDFDATRDEDSLLTFRHHFGPDTFAWEEPQASFVVLDDVIYRPDADPKVIGGLREDQFAFLERYLPTVPKNRLLVLAVHIPFFDSAVGRETFRRADRERLFGLLAGFPHVLLLSGHAHTQQHVFHGPSSGWHGAQPLHEYNVGASCGAFWSGAKDAQGIPAATMADGTPNGHARLQVGAAGDYALRWSPARVDAGDTAATPAMSLHAPRVLRRGAYPAWAVYANVYMGMHDSRVEYRIDGGQWRAMKRVEQPDPNLLAENRRDDEAIALRGYDRSPEASPSKHLWRGTLPTDLGAGMHRIDVRAFDRWQGEQHASTEYRLDEAKE
ncbi:calcineurin-like phosphoesterase C-terminal domain-containing protein [Montanilutibacter psychrotolerans]|uniref:Calcineurin phosphoesterase n=1 Tax=Montanilutibacter psychrotolerans TaxID=1327343 RepID=A0A3M8SYL3_9GAMM|nr:calcineurin-like phosphoesterase family protein [Lysobacter psychrotolerans]RNF86447.1 calcineurin phosphoesterase [Lysobacter psychrotolerans]